MTEIVTKVNPSTLPDAPSMGYSQISTCAPGTLVFISGQVAWRPDDAPVPEPLTEQAEIAMGNVVKALEAVGATVANITAMRAYLVNPTTSEFYEALSVMGKFLGDVKPTLTGVGVTALAGDELKIEIEATAVV